MQASNPAIQDVFCFMVTLIMGVEIAFVRQWTQIRQLRPVLISLKSLPGRKPTCLQDPEMHPEQMKPQAWDGLRYRVWEEHYRQVVDLTRPLT